MTVFSREDIEKIIPHRGEMLLVDDITLMDGEALGSTLIKEDAWFVRGHYPGMPVVPGVILCEMMAQASCVLFRDELCGSTPFFSGIDRARFRHTVVPGDVFRSVCTVTRSLEYMKTVSAKGYVGDILCVDASMSFVLNSGTE